ncbi:MAG: hypothetical protein M1812_005589 [Candelaria pacifica]|nr:MAG: hypothetical protein M1812_005589 [Candelaria pacifica]
MASRHPTKLSIREARKNEAQAFSNALASIPQRYHEMHPKGLLHHRVLKMLKARIADLKPTKDTPVAGSSKVGKEELSNNATIVVPSQAVIDDSDDDMTITDDETAAAEALQRDETTEEEESDIDGDNVVESPLDTSSQGKRSCKSKSKSKSTSKTKTKTKSKTNPSRPAETAEFATTLRTIPAKYRNTRFRGLLHHRVILMLREWIADLVEEVESGEERLRSIVDGATEVQRLRAANNLLLGKFLGLSKRLGKMDDMSSKSSRAEIDETIRKAWLCMTYGSEQEKEIEEEKEAEEGEPGRDLEESAVGEK